jgi:hypothetical protein
MKKNKQIILFVVNSVGDKVLAYKRCKKWRLGLSNLRDQDNELFISC